MVYLPYQLVQDFFHQPYVQATQKVQSGDCSASIGSTAVARSVGHPSHKKCAHVCQMSLHGTFPANIRHTPSCHLIGRAFAVELHLICLLLLAFFTFFEPRLKRLYEFAWAIKWIAPSKPAANTLPGSFVKNWKVQLRYLPVRPHPQVQVTGLGKLSIPLSQNNLQAQWILHVWCRSTRHTISLDSWQCLPPSLGELPLPVSHHHLHQRWFGLWQGCRGPWSIFIYIFSAQFLLKFIVLLKGCSYPSRGSSRTYIKSIAATAEPTRPCVPSQTGNHIFTIVEAAWRHISVAANLERQSSWSNDVFCWQTLLTLQYKHVRHVQN